MISLRALGRAEIVTESGRLTPSQEMLFAAALYLLIERPRQVSRARLAELLWPEAPETARYHRLRQTLLQLKRAGLPFTATRETVGIAQDAACSDLDPLFIHGTGDISLPDTFQFLPGYAPALSRPYADWLDSKRSEVTSALTRILLGEIGRARARGDWGRVEHLGLQCMEVDPFNEEAVIARAEGSAMRGAKREAVSILDRYVAELGPGTAEIKLPATLMRRRIAERIPDSSAVGSIERIFVGREADMESLTAMLAEACQSRGRSCLLWGDAGIGKTRLTCEIRRFAELQGAQVRRVACRRGSVQRPLSVFVELVPQLLQMRGALGCAPQTISDLGRLTQFDSAGKAPLDMEPQSIFAAIKAAIFDLVDAVAEEQTLLLAIEDVHWLDDISAGILGQLADWATTRRVFLLFTSRTADNPLVPCCTSAGLVRREVTRLIEKDSMAFLNQIFEAAGQDKDADLLRWCADVADGNPFFLHELAKQWFETKQRHTIPPSISSVIRERISRLGETATQILQACSILAEHSTLERIERMLGHPGYLLLRGIQQLSGASMINRAPQSGSADASSRLRVRHDLISGFILEELDSQSKSLLHRRAGAVLEEETAVPSPDASLMWACAFHWRHAGEPEKAYELAKRCAAHLLRVGLPEAAADAMDLARPFCKNKGQEIELLEMKISALEVASKFADLRNTINELRALQGALEQHDEIELKYLDASWRTSFEFKDSLTHARNCVSSHDATPDHRLRAACLVMKMASERGEFQIMDETYASILPLFEVQLADDMPRFDVQLIYECVRGDLSAASPLAYGLARVGRLANDTNLAIRALKNAATALRACGKTAEACELLSEGVDRANSARAYELARMLVVELARTWLIAGETQKARFEMDRVLSPHLPEPGDSHAKLDFLTINARLCLQENRVEEASNFYKKILPFVSALAVDRREMVLAIGIRLGTAAAWPRKELAPMVSELQSVYQICRHSNAQDYEVYSLYLGLSALGQEQKATALLLDYCANFRKDASRLPTKIKEILTRTRKELATGCLCWIALVAPLSDLLDLMQA